MDPGTLKGPRAKEACSMFEKRQLVTRPGSVGRALRLELHKKCIRMYERKGNRPIPQTNTAAMVFVVLRSKAVKETRAAGVHRFQLNPSWSWWSGRIDCGISDIGGQTHTLQTSQRTMRNSLLFPTQISGGFCVYLILLGGMRVP